MPPLPFPGDIGEIAQLLYQETKFLLLQEDNRVPLGRRGKEGLFCG